MGWCMFCTSKVALVKELCCSAGCSIYPQTLSNTNTHTATFPQTQKKHTVTKQWGKRKPQGCCTEWMLTFSFPSLSQFSISPLKRILIKVIIMIIKVRQGNGSAKCFSILSKLNFQSATLFLFSAQLRFSLPTLGNLSFANKNKSGKLLLGCNTNNRYSLDQNSS